MVLTRAIREVLVRTKGELEGHKETKGVALVQEIKEANSLNLTIVVRRLLGRDVVVTFNSKAARKR